MENITKENCLQHSNSLNATGDIDSQAKAWRTVHKYLCQKGMSIDTSLRGVENVITYLDALHDKVEELGAELNQERNMETDITKKLEYYKKLSELAIEAIADREAGLDKTYDLTMQKIDFMMKNKPEEI